MAVDTSRRVIDLRSDTVTRPSAEMLATIAALDAADVGDDVYGEDATVNKLQKYAAELTGKEAALFVPTGTMGNLASVLAHCDRGQELILGADSHIYHYETTPNGEIPFAALDEAVRDRPKDQHSARIACVTIENTHNRAGGRVLSLQYMQQLQQWAAAHQLPVHLDGARIFNAAVALGVEVRQLAALVTTMTFCLSKGLGAPVGSIIVGSAPFIDKVHRLRKQLGGGMRQVAVLAAPGLYALQHSPPLLAADHANARVIAQELAKVEQVTIDVAAVESNIILFHLKPEAPSVAVVLQRLRDARILVGGMKGGIRAVTHIDVTLEDCKCAVEAIREAVSMPAGRE